MFADEEFSHHLCDISFTYPSGWQVASSSVQQAYRGAAKHRCQFELKPSNQADSGSIYTIDHYSIAVTSSYQTFIEAALASEFRFSEGGWKLLPSLDGRVESIRLNRWYGLKGLVNHACNTKIDLPDAPTCIETRYVLGAPYSYEGHMVVVNVPQGAAGAGELLLNSLRSDSAR